MEEQCARKPLQRRMTFHGAIGGDRYHSMPSTSSPSKVGPDPAHHCRRCYSAHSPSAPYAALSHFWESWVYCRGGSARFFLTREPIMRMHWIVIAGLAVVYAMPVRAQQGPSLSAAADAMGATRLNSIQYTGSGSVFSFGQAYEPGKRWPRFIQRVYTAAINYQTPGMRLTQVRSQGEHPPRGGGAQAVAGRPTHCPSGRRQVRLAGGRSAGRAQSRRGRRPPAPIVGNASWRDQSCHDECSPSRRQHRHVQA